MVLALFVLLPALAGAEASSVPAVLKPRFELEMVPPGGPGHIHSQVSVEATVDLVMQLYRRAGPRIGCRLVEPSMVLTLSGARGLTAWNGTWRGATLEDAMRLEELDRFLVPRGISLQPGSDFLKGEGSVDVIHLAGVERVTRSSFIPATMAYHASSGWRGFYTWRDAQLKAYDRQRPVPVEAYHVLCGILLGYPDRAVLGYLGAGALGNERSISADIPYSNYYECGMPTFQFLPEDLDDPGILDKIHEWGELLRGIYEHPWMRDLDSNREFRQARREFLQSTLSPTMGWWSDERGRLGIWSAQRWAQYRALRACYLTDRHERVLRACVSELAASVRKGNAEPSLLNICRKAACELKLECPLSEGTLRAWVRRGARESAGSCRMLYEAAKVGHPEWLPVTPHKTSSKATGDDLYLQERASGRTGVRPAAYVGVNCTANQRRFQSPRPRKTSALSLSDNVQ